MSSRSPPGSDSPDPSATTAAASRIEVEGDPERLATCRRLPVEAPPLAVVEQVETRSMTALGERGFAITRSTAEGPRDVLVSPDVATCDDCLRELADPGDRRHRHPFVNCTNCGPRYTIVRDVPYDRATTTMARFDMCSACAREYDDPADRRFHAQPVCGPACGPRLRMAAADGEILPGDPSTRAAGELLAGRIVAVKSLGGYHLAVRADDGAQRRRCASASTVRTSRSRRWSPTSTPRGRCVRSGRTRRRS